MKKNIINAMMATVFGLYLLSGCTEEMGGKFETKEDSLQFATEYFKLYPDENKVITPFGLSDSGDVPGSQPISWEEVLRYKEQYDVRPLIYNPKGEALKGFSVDNKGYQYLQNNKDIQGLYLRLARRDDGNFTIMVLGTDAEGNVIELEAQKKSARQQADSTKQTDLDHLGVCPNQCPPNFE